MAIASTLAACLLLAAARAAQDEPSSSVLSLQNGDQISGRLHRLGDGRLSFCPDVAPNTAVAIDLEKVDRLALREAPEEKEKEKDGRGEGDLLTLRDGSVLYGRFVKLTDDALHFDLEGTGTLAFPRKVVDGLAAQVGGAASGDTLHEPGHHAVTLKSGSVLVGDLTQEASGALRVSGGAVEARFGYPAVAAIAFPRPPEEELPTWAKSGPALDAEEPDEDSGMAPVQFRAKKDEGVRAIVTTVRGTRLSGTKPALEDQRLAVSLAGGHRVRLPVEQIVDLAFTSTGATALRRQVLVWGAFSDRTEEFPRTVSILKEQLGAGWTVTENFSATLEEGFVSTLARAGVLLIPEMERGGSAEQLKQAATRLKPLAARFLGRGGNIIILGTTSGQTSFLREAGLLDVQQASSSSDSEVAFTARGRRLARGVGDAFTTTNSTQFYRIGPALNAVALAGTEAGSPVVGRRVGLGWTILMGMDYYESNPQTQTLLINAITHR
jgi:hypothetical protein